jgi:CBS-domain-containing membrane protein
VVKTWTVDDVMTKAVVSVQQTASYRALVDLLIGHRFSAVPVVDDMQRVTGVVSEADLLRKIEYAGAEEPRMFERRRRRGDRAKARGGTATDLMSSPPVVAPLGTTIPAAARLMDDQGVKHLPVVDELGRLVGIVSRGDLLKVHLRPDDEILDEVLAGVLRTYLPEEYEAVTVDVSEGVVTLAGTVGRWSSAELAARLTRQVAGVVEVVDRLAFDFDDRLQTAPSTLYGVV